MWFFAAKGYSLPVTVLEVMVNLKSGLLSIVTELFSGDSRLIDVAAAELIGTCIVIR